MQCQLRKADKTEEILSFPPIRLMPGMMSEPFIVKVDSIKVALANVNIYNPPDVIELNHQNCFISQTSALWLFNFSLSLRSVIFIAFTKQNPGGQNVVSLCVRVKTPNNFFNYRRAEKNRQMNNFPREKPHVVDRSLARANSHRLIIIDNAFPWARPFSLDDERTHRLIANFPNCLLWFVQARYL